VHFSVRNRPIALAVVAGALTIVPSPAGADPLTPIAPLELAGHASSAAHMAAEAFELARERVAAEQRRRRAAERRRRATEHRRRADARARRRRALRAVPIPGALASIAACESGGNPRAIGGGGLYRGKYQFDRGTWASVGGSGDPAAAPEAEQDMRAALLYARAGASPWPVCG